MSAQPIYRPALTALLVQRASQAAVHVGRGSAPQVGGWNDNTFEDYVVIKAGVASTPARGEPERLGRYGTSWDASTQIIGHGETEQRCDEAASAVFEQIFTIDGIIDLGGVSWQIQKVVINSMGATEWSSQNKAWRVVYDVSLHLSRQDTR